MEGSDQSYRKSYAQLRFKFLHCSTSSASPLQGRVVWRFGDAWGNCLIVRPLPNSTTEEYEKYMHLKCIIKTSVDKKNAS